MMSTTSTEVCHIHGKRRRIDDLCLDGGKYRCLQTKLCRLEGEGEKGAEVCVTHGKRRLVVDMTREADGWRCLPNKVCRDDNARCRLHGRLRLMADLTACGNGEYECKAARTCYVSGTGAAVTAAGYAQHSAGVGNAAAGITSGSIGVPLIPNGSLPAAGASTDPSVSVAIAGVPVRPVPTAAAPTTVRSGGASTLWCHLHGKRIPTTRAERVEGAFNVCKDAYVCFSGPLETSEALVASGCVEVFCSVHGALRSPMFVEPRGERGYGCVAGHPCTGATSALMLEKARRWDQQRI